MTKVPTQISLATDTDFKALASIVLRAQEQDPYHKLLFDRSQPSSAQDELDHTELLVWSGIKSDNCRVWKAVTEETRMLRKKQTAVGLSIIDFVNREPAPPTSNSTSSEVAPVYRHQPQSLNSRLLESTHTELERLQNTQVGEQKYVLWRHLYVLPEHQGEGIEGEMIQWGFEHFGLANHTVVVETTRPETFLRYGWKVVHVLNLDLGVWGGGKEAGANGYCVSVLVRNPGKLGSESLAEKVDEKSS
jgi:hypothetical protein